MGLKVVSEAPPAAPRPPRSAQQQQVGSSAGGKLDSGTGGSMDDVPFSGTHVLELPGLTRADREEHIEALVEQLPVDTAPNIRWVDDQHVLLLFSDPVAARRAQQRWPADTKYTNRPFIEASAASKRMPVSDLQPAKPRPKTTTAIARRLIGSALNMSGALRDRDAERELATQRRQQQGARQQRVQRQAQVDAAWED